MGMMRGGNQSLSEVVMSQNLLLEGLGSTLKLAKTGRSVLDSRRGDPGE